MSRAPATTADPDVLRALYRERPRSGFLRASLALAVLGMIAAVVWAGWPASHGDPSGRLDNLLRFVAELRPGPWQGANESMGDWAGRLLARVLPATAITVGIAIVATGLAAGLGMLASVVASRALTGARPMGVARPGGRRWRLAFTGTRAALLLARAVPEYLLAFLTLVLLGPGPWAAVVALAVHNAGILGRLMAELLDDTSPDAARVALAAGNGRLTVGGLVLWPAIATRALVYVLYRWETCVRESVVLGMLGFASLGLWVRDARARGFYDELLVYVLAGACVVIAGDVASGWVRRWLREG